MASGIKKKELLEMKTDLKLLLECLDFQKDDTVAVKQALVTISSILQGSVEVKDVFRDIGGLEQVLTLVTSHDTSEVVETGLYCLGCAVERNVHSQKLLTTGSVFTFLHGILSSTSRTSVRKKQTASFLVLCLVSNNGFGQNLVRQSSCLHDILSLIRTTMPRNIQDLDSDWFEGMDGKSLHLWCTLLSTACACVNNPINEGNQRICASLLPYLFSLLTGHSDERILRPVLSHIGLTVSGNESNQDRVRKCGGLEIFVKKLGSLRSQAISDTTSKVLAVQLLSTVDACISDNESNSARFGELGGIKQVLALLSECCLDLVEKIQAVLTLAHALDAYNGNQKYVTECGGVTVLIQQLTETQDEEFSKTIKYLLHMCVSSGKSSLSDADNHLTDSERLINKMEAMKRHNDVEMLKKIRELDSKVKSMENKHQQLDHTQHVTTNLNTVLERLEGYTMPVNPEHNFERARSPAGSSGELSGQQDCPTPREKSLMEQLIKEKVEKERLEKLNYMLQENICKTHTALTNARIESKSGYIPTTDPQKTCSIPADRDRRLQERNNPYISTVQQQIPDTATGSYRTRENNCTVSDTQFVNDSYGNGYARNVNIENENSHPVLLRTDEAYPLNRSLESREMSPMVTRSGLRYRLPDVQESRYKSVTSDINNNSLERHKHLKQPHTQLYNNGNPTQCTELEYGCNMTYKNMQNNLALAVNPDITFDKKLRSQVEESKTFPLVATPLDLSCNAKNFHTKSTGESWTLNTVNHTQTVNLNSAGSNEAETIETPNLQNEHSESRFEPKIKTAINKNAEIQCGTPWINKCSENEKTLNENMCVSDNSSQTNFVKQHYPGKNSGHGPESTKGKRLLIEKIENSDHVKENKTAGAHNSNSEKNRTPVVILTDCETHESVISDHKNANEVKPEKSIVSKSSPVSSASRKSSGLFVKPKALPPKRKVRVTPLLGSDKLSGARFLLSKMAGRKNINNSSKVDEYDSDVQSEFDLNLFKNVGRQQACVKPVPVIKSQNNVRQIDRVVEKRESNAAEKWQIHPSTPHRQGIVPPRPAFSDCGTRRCVLNSPSSIKSQGTRRRSLDDSGIHSPRDILNISPKSPNGSPVDSNIDGFRSSSDVSDDEEGPPNISAAVLRSSKKLNKNTVNKCPGCTGFYTSGGGLELNSRTYNIALETDPNTCPVHRKLRQIERVYINKIRKSKGLRSKLKRKLHNRLPVTTSDIKLRETIYEFSSESADNISPPSDENAEFRPPDHKKKRSKRIPYTTEEEQNLLEGVSTLGKHWNQILVTYDFHPSRTNVDLMDKYKRMRASNSRDAASSKCQSVMSRTKSHKPFSMCEERRLRRGIMKFGYSWKTILNSFTFAQGRTTEDLRNKWRILHKKM